MRDLTGKAQQKWQRITERQSLMRSGADDFSPNLCHVIMTIIKIFGCLFVSCGFNQYVFVSDPQGLGRWEEERLSQTLGLLREHRPAQGGQVLAFPCSRTSSVGPRRSLLKIVVHVVLSLPMSITSSSHLLVKLPRLQNCVSSFSAANAAAATGGIRTASPHSTAAMPSSSRRWSDLDRECV